MDICTTSFKASSLPARRSTCCGRCWVAPSLWVKLLEVPKAQLYAGILIFATVGVYGMRQSAFDLFLLHAIGLLGLVMQRFDFPAAPVVIGMILGPLAEAQLRNALFICEGKWACCVGRSAAAASVGESS